MRRFQTSESTVQKWEFPKTRGYLNFGVLIIRILLFRVPTILGTILGSPFFGNPQVLSSSEVS